MEKMLTYVVKLYSKKRCLGTREILAEEDELQPNGRVFKKVGLKCVWISVKFLYSFENEFNHPN